MSTRGQSHLFTHAVLSMVAAGTLLIPAAEAATGGWAGGRVLVKFHQGVSESQIAQVLKANMSRSVKCLGRLGLCLVEVPLELEQSVATALSNDARVAYAELDRRAEPAETTANDPHYAAAWHLPMIGVPQAWDNSLGDGVTVAVVDTGVDVDHPDLVGKLVPGYNVVDNNTDTGDLVGHGSKVAGIIGAATNNALLVSGIGWNTQIMPIRVSTATNGYTYWSDVAAGLIWAADHGAQIANVSYEVTGSAGIAAAAQYMRDKGGVVVVPAGNDGLLQSTPDDPNMITVAATDPNDLYTSWSSFGPMVDLGAPGTNIYTTNSYGDYAMASGTSFAAPVVAGVAALVLAANPDLTPAAVEQILKDSAVDLGTFGRDDHYGNGRVNAAAAVTMALAWTPPPADLESPAAAISSPSDGSPVAGTLSMQVSATDNLGVTAVKCYANGVLIGTDTTAPYAMNLDTTPYPNGSLQLSARAYDAAGNETLANAVTVTVSNGTVELTPPTVRITAPTPNRTVTSTIIVSGTATDNVKVATMTFYVDDVRLCTNTKTTLSCAWRAASAASGTHIITLIATDTSGNAASTQVSVTR